MLLSITPLNAAEFVPVSAWAAAAAAVDDADVEAPEFYNPLLLLPAACCAKPAMVPLERLLRKGAMALLLLLEVALRGRWMPEVEPCITMGLLFACACDVYTIGYVLTSASLTY